MLRVVRVAVIAMATALIGCEAEPARQLVSITIDPPSQKLEAGSSDETMLTATGHYDDGWNDDVTLDATWRSSDPDVVVVTSDGVVVLGIDPGTAATGYGVVTRGDRGAVTLVECGVIRTSAKEPLVNSPGSSPRLRPWWAASGRWPT